MNIYNTLDPIEYLSWRISTWPHSSRGVKKALAEALNVHSSFISQVLNYQKLLSVEMALPLARFLNLNPLSTEYLVLIVQYQQAGTVELKTHLLKQCELLQAKSQKVSSRISQKKQLKEKDKIIFYSKWYYSAIHLSLFLDDVYSVKDIASKLNLPKQVVLKALNILSEIGLCKENESGFFDPIDISTHIPDDSPLVTQHHQNWRVESLRWVELSDATDLQFTGPVTIELKNIKAFREKILNLIEDYSSFISDGKKSELCVLNIDFRKY